MQLFKKDKKTNHSASIDYSLVNKLSDEMREIFVIVNSNGKIKLKNYINQK